MYLLGTLHMNVSEISVLHSEMDYSTIPSSISHTHLLCTCLIAHWILRRVCANMAKCWTAILNNTNSRRFTATSCKKHFSSYHSFCLFYLVRSLFANFSRLSFYSFCQFVLQINELVRYFWFWQWNCLRREERINIAYDAKWQASVLFKFRPFKQ